MYIWLLLCSGLLTVIQAAFLIRFSGVPSRAYYYVTFAGAAFLSYLLDACLPAPYSIFTKMLCLFLGVGIVFVFSRAILKQDSVTSAVLGVLLVTTNILAESLLLPLRNIAASYLPLGDIASTAATGLLIPVATCGFLHFFSVKYHISSGHRPLHLLILAAPMLFIDILMRTMMDFRYLQDYELFGLSVFAFLCVCGMLLSYEKALLANEGEQEKELLLKELDLQKNYIAEAASRYEATRAFRHDLKNHLITLGGMMKHKELDRAGEYLKHLEAVSGYISVPVYTGNVVLDILLSEKLSHAKNTGIHVICDIMVSPDIRVDDFDLSVLFSNSIDNAIRACSYVTDGRKTLDITAKQRHDFFILDMKNSYEPGTVPAGSGLGLPSIQRIAKKYHGTVEIDSEGRIFRLSVLLLPEKNETPRVHAQNPGVCEGPLNKRYFHPK